METFRINHQIHAYKQQVFEFSSRNEIKNNNFHLPISPLLHWIKAEINHVQKGYIEANFRVTPKLINPGKVLHGGVQCAILDELIGVAGSSLGFKNFLFAVDLKVDYMRPANLNEKLTVIAKIIRKGNNIINCTGEIRNQSGKIISQARSNLIKKNNSD